MTADMMSSCGSPACSQEPWVPTYLSQGVMSWLLRLDEAGCILIAAGLAGVRRNIGTAEFGVHLGFHDMAPVIWRRFGGVHGICRHEMSLKG
jgi:hypothetical protein